MFKTFRRYRSAVILVLMSMMMVGFFVDEFNDSQQYAKQTAMPLSMAVMVDDFDFGDEDENEIDESQCLRGNFCINIRTDVTDSENLAGSKCSLALLRGQVRRHSPRSSLADSHNYTLLPITKSGVDLNPCHFFILSKSTFLNIRLNKNLTVS